MLGSFREITRISSFTQPWMDAGDSARTSIKLNIVLKRDKKYSIFELFLQRIRQPNYISKFSGGDTKRKGRLSLKVVCLIID